MAGNANSGRTRGRQTPLQNSDAIRARMQTSALVNRLTKVALGEVESTPQAVSAALGLLRKVMPDLSAQAIKLEEVKSFVVALPPQAESMDEWLEQAKRASTPSIQ